MASVNEIKAAVDHLIYETGDVEMAVGQQIEKIDEIASLLTDFENESAHASIPLMAAALQRARRDLEATLRSLISFMENGQEYKRYL